MQLAELVAAKPFLIEQDYTKYTLDQRLLWRELVERRMAERALGFCREYLQGCGRWGAE